VYNVAHGSLKLIACANLVIGSTSEYIKGFSSYIVIDRDY